VVFLLAIQAALLSWSVPKHSPTLNEPAHLVAGISYWKFGRFDLYRVNPPLIRLITAFPVLAFNPKVDWEPFEDFPGARPVFEYGRSFVRLNGEDTFLFIPVARWSTIPICLLGGYICFLWSSQLYGTFSGILSLIFWTFSPNILAHGQLITVDAGATSFGLLAAYTFWRWLERPNWKNAILAGVATGVAELTKMTWLCFFGLWPILFILRCIHTSKKKNEQLATKNSVAQLFLILLLTIYTINAGYGFEGTLTPLRNLPFVSDFLTDMNTKQNRFSDSWVGKIPVLLPRNYLLGLDIQRRDFENNEILSYLRGEFRNHGWWYYYIYALIIKVPIGIGVLFILTITSCLFKWDKYNWNSQNEFILLLPAFTIILLVSSQTGFTHHMRYVLPAFPFIFIWTSQIGKYITLRTWRKGFIISGCIFEFAFSSLRVYPHSLSYFNELAGGPENGHNHLIHSNVDWGQDLLYLKEWLKEHPQAAPFYIAYYGDFDIRNIGFDYPKPPIHSNISSLKTPKETFFMKPGWYAISVNYLRGDPWLAPHNAWAYFQKLTPDFKAGYSIYIYNVSLEDANMINNELNKPKDVSKY
jgi:4-amino-4-deoxy-L-arabinose transferase-like glycosyltransferase